MSQAGSNVVPRRSVQIRLTDLIAWVLGAGVLSGIWRRLDAERWFQAPPGLFVDLERIFGLSALSLAVFLVLGLSRQVLARVGKGRRELVPVAWRVVAALMLGLFMVGELPLLQDEPTGLAAREPIRGRGILPVVAALGMAGILAGLSGESRRVGGTRRGSVLWAGISGIAIVSAQMMVPYLVLLAMAAVENALVRTDWAWRARPSLYARLLRAGVEAIPAVACCLALALRISDAFTKPRGESSGKEIRALLLGSCLAAGTGAWLIWVTLPGLNPWLSEGLWIVLSEQYGLAIVLGFAGLSFGIVARASEHGGEVTAVSPSRGRRGFQIVVLFIVALFVAELVASLVGEGLMRGGYVGRARSPGFGGLIAFVEWLLSSPRWLTDRNWELATSFARAVLGLLEAWLAWRIGWLLVTPPVSDSSPVDRLLADRRDLGRLAVRWLALTVLMLAALPSLFLAGLLTFHLAIYSLG